MTKHSNLGARGNERLNVVYGWMRLHFDITNISMTFSNNGLPPNISISLRASISFLLRNSRTYSKVPVRPMISKAYCFTSTDVGFWLTILRSCRLDESARIAWMIGNENLPSVKSSQNPLFFVYYHKHAISNPSHVALYPNSLTVSDCRFM